MPSSSAIFVFLLVLIALTGCAPGTETPQAPATDPDVPPSPNAELLDGVNASGAWFHAKKTRPIWARQVESDQTVTTLEGEEQVSAGDFLCRGEAGDIWPQKAHKLADKYEPTETVDEDGWRLYQPHPDAAGVLAAQLDRPFTVEATWGTLHGKAGDFLVKHFDDGDVDHPEDVWIVDQALFAATYAAVEDG